MAREQDRLVDKFGREHTYLRIALTEKCNLRCFYCMPPEGIQLAPRAHLMTASEVEQLVGTFVDMGIRKVRFTGGEPLVRKDAGEIMERLSGFPIEMGITTNGILVDRYIDRFRSCGLRSVNISLDSLQKDRFIRITRRDHFDKVKANIDLLLREGFRVKLNTVVMKGVNDDEVVDMVRSSVENELEVKFIEFMPFDGNAWEWEKGVSSSDLLRRIELAFPGNIEKIEDQPNDTAKSFRVKGAQGSFGFISTVSEPFCASCNRLRITADGKMKNCLFSQGEADLLKAIREGDDIRPLIKRNLKQKAWMRGGMESFESFSDRDRNSQNRSMIKIGG